MAPPNDPLQIGDWLVDPRDDSLTRGAERIKLEPRTMRLLMTLAQAPGAVVSQDQLLETVWAGVVVGPASVYQSVSQLRKVMGDTDDPPRYIATVARKGYRLVAPVAPVMPVSPRSSTPGTTDDSRPPTAASVDAPRRGSRKRVAVVALTVAVALLVGFWQSGWRSGAPGVPPTVVVLPFLDLTEGKTEGVFCDGLAEETSNWLAQIPTLHVVARTSAFAYRNRNKDVRLIGQELQTTHMIEGSIRKSGDHLRITVQLIDTRTGLHVWSESYDFEKGDALRMQEDIARKVADNLELRVTADVGSRFADRRSRNAEAQRLYLLAKAHGQNLDSESNEKSIDLYRQALKVDPDFVLAKVWLANAIVKRRGLDSQPIETLAPEVEALLAEVEKAAPDLSDLYVVRGSYYTELRRREDAIRDLRHALELNPNSSSAATKLGFYFLTAGEPREALTYYTMAAIADPKSSFLQSARCMALTQMAQLTVAQAACERARALGPDSVWVYNTSSTLEEARGDLEAAIRWNDQALEHGSDMASIQGERALWLLALGLIEDARTVCVRARAASPEGARNNSSLLYVGSLIASVSGGAKGLRDYMHENGLDAPEEPTQMLQLANAAMTAGAPELANQLIDAALASPKLVEEDLASPWQASTGYSDLVVIAAALRARGDEAGAERRLRELQALLDRMADSGVRTYGVFHLRAQLEAMRGRGDQAMSALQQAVQLGWRDSWTAQHLPYLRPLHARDDFRQLLAAVDARNAATAAKLRGRLAR
ncbi:MAG TPA: winged helix-turn-helix domain-containing protein [Steroidobacteraceae bacterium]|nr:winged helix-turn-helix domain-containing protein [Steroidobacteraceae bacterium]